MEKKMLMTVHEICTETQLVGSEEEHLAATARFSLSTDDEVFEDLSVMVKQVLGSDYSKAGLEVGKVEGYKGPLDYEKFREAIEDCYRWFVGEQARIIQLGPGAKNTSIENCSVAMTREYELPLPERTAGW